MKKILSVSLTIALTLGVLTLLPKAAEAKKAQKTYPACAERPTVAIDTFQTENIYIGWSEFAGNARDVVVEELVNSGCYRVVERDRGPGVAKGYHREQDIRDNYAAPGQHAAQKQRVKLATYLIQFALTGASKDNIGGSLAGAGFGGGKWGLGAISPKGSTISMTCRMYDSSTSEVLAASKVQKTKFDIGLLGAGGGNWGIGGDFFYKTPVGKTIAALIHECAVDLTQKTQGTL